MKGREKNEEKEKEIVSKKGKGEREKKVDV
jgi:hypothetical protein